MTDYMYVCGRCRRFQYWLDDISRFTGSLIEGSSNAGHCSWSVSRPWCLYIVQILLNSPLALNRNPSKDEFFTFTWTRKLQQVQMHLKYLTRNVQRPSVEQLFNAFSVILSKWRNRILVVTILTILVTEWLNICQQSTTGVSFVYVVSTYITDFNSVFKAV